MAAITANLPGTAIISSPHVTILHPSIGQVTLDITESATSHANIGVDWAEMTRGQRTPLLLLRGYKLETQTLRAFLVGNDRFDDTADVTLHMLKLMAGDPTPVTVAYGSLEAGFWQITDLAFASSAETLRSPTSNGFVQADVTLSLKAASTIPPAPGDAAAPVPVASTAPSPGSPGARINTGLHRVTVGAGDTLMSISNSVWGTPAGWSAIATANGVFDPRTLAVGQVLIIP